MRYFSTNRNSPHVTFRQAVLAGQPPDKGLYFPEQIPSFDFADLRERSKEETAYQVIKPYVGGEITDEKLFQICAETVNFDFPLKKITESITVLELFHGATFAFKDVGARFMSRCLQHFSAKTGETTIVVVATSGDTGGAVAAGFLGVEDVEVVILYPAGKVSKLQELQLTTLGENITALEVAGSFDDCQRLAKTALADEELKKRVFLTSANSINVARWLPQQFYYFYALQQWLKEFEISDLKFEMPVISVPSGNFGNICAGLLARASSLPVRHFIAACNANDVVPKFLQTGEMLEQQSVVTLSNAMDVAVPSNFVRILELFSGDREKLTAKMSAWSITDETTADTMRRVYKDYGYVLDPHAAIGFYALEQYLESNPNENGFFLATAHPAKFDSVKEIVGTFGEIPAAVEDLFARPKQSVEMPVDYERLKEILLSKI